MKMIKARSRSERDGRPPFTHDDVIRIREIVRQELDTRANLVEPVAPQTSGGMIQLAVDAFDAASFVANGVAALAIGLARTVIR